MRGKCKVEPCQTYISPRLSTCVAVSLLWQQESYSMILSLGIFCYYLLQKARKMHVILVLEDSQKALDLCRIMALKAKRHFKSGWRHLYSTYLQTHLFVEQHSIYGRHDAQKRCSCFRSWRQMLYLRPLVFQSTFFLLNLKFCTALKDFFSKETSSK